MLELAYLSASGRAAEMLSEVPVSDRVRRLLETAMPRSKSRKPQYCLHKSSGRAYVAIDGRPIYLGRHGSPGSHDKYNRVIGEWIARGLTAPVTTPAASDAGPTVSIVVAAF